MSIFQSSNISSYAAEQFHNDTSLEAMNEGWTARKTGSERRKVTSACDDRHHVVFSNESRFNLRNHGGRNHVILRPVNANFQSALSNDKVAEYTELWSRVGFRIMDDPFCYKFWIVSIATGPSEKLYSLKLCLSFKAVLKLHFSRIMDTYMLQFLFKDWKHATSSLSCFFAGYVTF